MIYHILFGIPIAAISSMQIIQWMWLCPDRLPVIRVVFISKQILRARVLLEQVVILKIILTYLL